MKKAVFLLFTLIIFNFSFLYSETENKAVKKDKKIIDITIGVGLRNIPEDSYKKIFGSNNLVYSADFGFRLWKSVELFLHTDYLSLKGKTTNTKEKTSFRLVPVEFGLRFLIEKKKISPYIGAGGGSYSYRDEMEIDNETSKVSGKKFGFFLETGLRYLFYKSIFFDIKAKYIFLDVKPDAPDNGSDGIVYIDERELGGFALIAGIGISL